MVQYKMTFSFFSRIFVGSNENLSSDLTWSILLSAQNWEATIIVYTRKLTVSFIFFIMVASIYKVKCFHLAQCLEVPTHDLINPFGVGLKWGMSLGKRVCGWGEPLTYEEEI